MGLFNFKKKGAVKKETNKNVNSFGEPIDRLTPDGELPWGWIYANKDFTDKTQSEYRYFMKNWIESRNKSPKEQYAALKSFVMYINDLKALCQSKGECFVEWFKLLADDDYITTRENELKELETNFDKLETEYREKEKLLKTLEADIADKLSKNEGILQSDFVKLFDPIIQNEVKESLYYMSQSEIIKREKHGRSYILSITKKG